MRSFEQWLAYQTQVHPQAIDLGLDRLRSVLKALGWRQPSVPVISVAGTNGKGSVTAYCVAILSAAGYRVGSFTSPHLRDYRERIRLHDRLASEAELIAVFDRIETARASVALTFFEFNTLAALLLFQSVELDAWVLEIGMGGRLDAVNVVDADVAVVVSIGLDHQEYLGNTLEAIAREKAGIFRPGHTAVLGGTDMPASLEQIAATVGSPVKRYGVEYTCTRQTGSWRFRGAHWDLPHLPVPALRGDIQFANAATALAALEELESRLTIDAPAVARGLKSVRLPGRYQVIAATATMPEWILDVAHNVDAARVLGANLSAAPHCGKTFAVCGILADKDATAIAASLRDAFDAWWCASIDGARGRSGAALAQIITAAVTVEVLSVGSVGEACAQAAARAGPHDRIVIFGSFHTVGPALEWLEAAGYRS